MDNIIPAPLLLTLLLMIQHTASFEELPKFDQLTLLYPGYHLYGGRHRDADITALVGDRDTDTHSRLATLHNTASLRLSLTLNRYGGRHALPTEPVLLSKHGRDSVTGDDGCEYIFRNTAFGPYLAAKYGNPDYVKVKDVQNGAAAGSDILDRFAHRQGIIRMVNYNHQHAAGHVGLWDCDHFVQSRDWSHDTQLIAVEFWESPDSYCPPQQSVTPNTASVTLDMSRVQIVARHNVPVSSSSSSSSSEQLQRHGSKRRRHHGNARRQKETIWLQ